VDNIQAGLSQADPAHAGEFSANADRYKARLRDLDQEIRKTFDAIPPADRILVTDHDDLGYFADRYGLRVVGMIVPSVSSDSAPSAQHMVRLISIIEDTGVKAVFTEVGSNPRLARQIAEETGVQVVAALYTHSLSKPGGPAGTYLDMLRTDARVIAQALAR
jgi:ABC-type Zn uptake system ZnuABC Zn-binding protein ZnuA